jgi:signal transduction histidine kinase
MKNGAVLRRLLLGSLIVSATVPLVYHTALNYMRSEYYENLTAQVCKAVEPQVQMGVFRTPIEYAQGMMLRQGFDYVPEVVFIDHGNEITPAHKNRLGQIRTDCVFAGYPNVRMSIYYEMAPYFNLRYAFLYLFSVPIFFLLFVAMRALLEHFQRQVVDTVQLQIKNLLELDTVDVKANTGTIGRMLDLNIPLLGYLKDHIAALEEKLMKYSLKIAEQKKSEVLADVAVQVAHDIVAPISILQDLLKDRSDSGPRDQSLVLEELGRMKALANKMLRQYRGESVGAEHEKVNLSELLQVLAIEAETLAKAKCTIEGSIAPNVVVEGVRSELAAALTNIVRNAIDAMDKPQSILRVSLHSDSTGAQITIRDNGCGISQSNLGKIFDRGFTSGKVDGNGLGLFQAKSAVEAMGGTLNLESQIGVGTTVEIKLPARRTVSPIEIALDADSHLVFLDDSPVIHETWRKILPSDLPSDRTHFFLDGDGFKQWVRSHPGINVTYFVDHDLSSGGPSGLDVIESEGIAGSSILVTSRVSDKAVSERAQAMSIRIIDKADLNRVRFSSIGQPNAEIVLIDDSRANRLSWEAQASAIGRKLRTFVDGPAFLREASVFPSTTPIYVDYLFEGEAVGPSIAEQAVRAGFSNVFLATAYPKERIIVPNGVRGVVGKDFPG